MSRSLRYVVFDSTPQANGLGCTADELASALRAPLVGVGVRVLRRRRSAAKLPYPEFQTRGLSRSQYEVKAIEVAAIVEQVTKAYRKVQELVHAPLEGDFQHNSSPGEVRSSSAALPRVSDQGCKDSA